MNTRLLYALLGVNLLFLPHLASATHVRGGEIIYRQDSLDPFTVHFEIIVYRDQNGIDLKDLTFYSGDTSAGILLGDDQVTVTTYPQAFLPDTDRWFYQYSHTYDKPGKYLAATVVQNRNRGVSNFGSGASDMYSFYVETQVDLTGPTPNTSPRFAMPLLTQIAGGFESTYALTAYDPDGDSLSYRLVLPRYFEENSVDGSLAKPLPNYFFTNSTAEGDTIWIEPVTGVLHVTNTLFGESTYAVEVSEWDTATKRRKGYVVRDFQLLIEDRPAVSNEPPRVKGPVTDWNAEFWVSPERPLEISIVAAATVGESATLFVDGEPLRLLGAAVEVEHESADTAWVTFRWTPPAGAARSQPYDVVFRKNEYKDLSTAVGTASDLVVRIHVDRATALDDRTARPFLKVYPNPTADVVRFELPDLTGATRFYLYNATGQLVYLRPLNHTPSFAVDLRTLPTGAYLYRVQTTSGQIWNGRLVRQ
ncbi:Por secretion system C-terminal sorting domain-containing protein [Catalinimonas alkaloidigena]|uniref:Por secretion system C-terminal sorting domain-containing protein n=1 Tax=Catalinimonas alkaloidigena TaxID=1075417 RepID=A0A1G9BWR8_9BACT|nr:T9SS type A sorting domain-containing protein [Catalinimonas alkaloidigena]SDK43624.1 Por secretion system C-terminal sorting domain-containing protein [Catalinimonas alkaloidigena]